MDLVMQLAGSIGGFPLTVVRSHKEPSVFRVFIAEQDTDPSDPNALMATTAEDGLAIMEFVMPVDATSIDDVEAEAKRWKHGAEALAWHRANGTVPAEGFPEFAACLMYADARWMLGHFPLLNTPMDLLPIAGSGERIGTLKEWPAEKASQLLGLVSLLGGIGIGLSAEIASVRPDVKPDADCVQSFVAKVAELKAKLRSGEITR